MSQASRAWDAYASLYPQLDNADPLPVLLRFTGRAAWWSPTWLTRILPDIHFSHS